ncbi:NAD(P)-dependent dehydrogenase (short-subunit alcohol dehydrogenase family) [Nonomuraea thailandensis]|uniref:NAD(P)-dependent dehydrogenase (Short-subunit alcohol dehydrogenase family) n=1 Tax=Nonomuraea thailandensis TaxID=1188745 RepID=A0A9X2GJ12_9ACTN|nr:SDR family oxidoreductase [Nonomuraea thailandensis]MCP2356296.1 NAD(P)-dependent dehydrogenase (short-subunit alcohol dehydrogenase family) [Nonomuraea thailandensis]
MLPSTPAVALVTGANKGLGLATARQLAERGCTVLLGSRDPGRGLEAAAELTGAGLTARPVRIDVTDDASVTEAAAFIEREYGRLDVLVNNAGVLLRRPAREVSADDLRPEFETNVFGLVRVVHAMLPLLRRSPSPRIVNVSSDSATFANATEQGSMFARSHDSFAYSATKTAVNMLTVKYANAFLDDPDLAHIKINAVTPGYVATDLNGFKGVRSTEEGARAAVHWATIGDDGETGGFFGDQGRVSW